MGSGFLVSIRETQLGTFHSHLRNILLEAKVLCDGLEGRESLSGNGCWYPLRSQRLWALEKLVILNN